MTMNLAEILDQLATLDKNVKTKVDEIAARYRKEVLLPLCRRLGLEYRTEIVFKPRRGEAIRSDYDARGAGYLELVDAYEILRLRVPSTFHFPNFLGTHVKAISLPKKKHPRTRRVRGQR